MVDQLPVEPAPEAPLPRRATLELLVGRVTTIKLAYWVVLTTTELLLPAVVARPFAERFAASVALAVAISTLALLWSHRAARARDPRAGYLSRSIPAIATTFAATTVVASPASLPLLVVERERSLEACGVGACHLEAMVLWVAILLVGTVLIPAVFAASLRTGAALPSLGR